jgi:hypothetical protein
VLNHDSKELRGRNSESEAGGGGLGSSPTTTPLGTTGSPPHTPPIHLVTWIAPSGVTHARGDLWPLKDPGVGNPWSGEVLLQCGTDVWGSLITRGRSLASGAWPWLQGRPKWPPVQVSGLKAWSLSGNRPSKSTRDRQPSLGPLPWRTVPP